MKQGSLQPSAPFSLNSVDQFINLHAGSLLLLSLDLLLGHLALQLVEEDGKEAKGAHVSRANSGGGLSGFGNGLNDVAWPEDLEEEPPQNDEANENGD